MQVRYFNSIFFLLLLALLPVTLSAQNGPVIRYNSTCAARPVLFTSTVFETAPFPDSIRWNFGDTASGIYNTAIGIQDPLHIFSDTGKYVITLRVTDPGMGVIILTDTIAVVNQVMHQFGPDIFGCGDTATQLLLAPSGYDSSHYVWNDDSATVGPRLIVRTSGTYTVSIRGCSVSDTIGVFFTPEPVLDLGRNHTLCSGERLSLNAVNENARYTWYRNGILLPDTTGQLPVQMPGGTYVAALDVAGCGAYRDTVSIVFSDSLAPAFSLGPDTLLCPKEIFPLTAALPGASAYNWGSKGLEVDDAIRYDIAFTPVISVNQPGRYWAFVTTAKGCEVVDTVLVRYRNEKSLDFRDTALCEGNTLILDADFGTGTYLWTSSPKQRTDQDITNQSTYYVYSPALITLRAQVGHCVYTDSLQVSFNDSLRMSLTKDTTLCRGETYTLFVKGNANTYTWQDNSVGDRYTPVQSGEYSVIGKNGCGSDTLSVLVAFDDCPCNLLLPNAFTPNGDGRNDFFRPLHACDMEQYTMTIFNRYGERIYVNRDPLKGWDGRMRNSMVPQGGYVWIVDYIRTSTRERITKKGTVLVLQ